MSEHTLNLKDALEYMLAGKSIFTLQNSTNGNRYTFKIKKLKNKDLWFVSVLTGNNNENDYTFLGTIFYSNNKYNYKHSLKSRATKDAVSVKVITWFLEKIQVNKVPDFIKFYHMNHCGRCGRTLTVPESVTSGYGPECIQLVVRNRNLVLA